MQHLGHVTLKALLVVELKFRFQAQQPVLCVQIGFPVREPGPPTARGTDWLEMPEGERAWGSWLRLGHLGEDFVSSVGPCDDSTRRCLRGSITRAKPVLEKLPIPMRTYGFLRNQGRLVNSNNHLRSYPVFRRRKRPPQRFANSEVIAEAAIPPPSPGNPRVVVASLAGRQPARRPPLLSAEFRGRHSEVASGLSHTDAAPPTPRSKLPERPSAPPKCGLHGFSFSATARFLAGVITQGAVTENFRRPQDAVGWGAAAAASPLRAAQEGLLVASFRRKSALVTPPPTGFLLPDQGLPRRPPSSPCRLRAAPSSSSCSSPGTHSGPPLQQVPQPSRAASEPLSGARSLAQLGLLPSPSASPLPNLGPRMWVYTGRISSPSRSISNGTGEGWVTYRPAEKGGRVLAGRSQGACSMASVCSLGLQYLFLPTGPSGPGVGMPPAPPAPTPSAAQACTSPHAFHHGLELAEKERSLLWLGAVCVSSWGAGSQGSCPRERSQLDKRHRGFPRSLSPPRLAPLSSPLQFCEPISLTCFPA